MEFHFGLWNGVSALYSASGRQLGEDNTRPLRLNHGIPAETINCKYAGSRNGRAINMSALRIAMQNFDEALAITAAVKNHHLAHRPQTHILGIWDLYIMARASIALIAYQKRFTRQNSSGPRVDDALASQYQFISGVFMICRDMMENADPAIAKNHPITAEALYRYADEHGIFLSFNGMACAGSTKKILDFLAFCCTGDGETAKLTDIVNEPENWYQYALATVELDCFIEAERAHRRAKEGANASTSFERAREIYRNLGNYARQQMDDPEAVTEFLLFEDSALARQNRILRLLGRPTISEIPRDHFIARMA